MQNQVIIISTGFANFDTRQITIGGVQTYIKDLAELVLSLGHSCYVAQFSKRAGEPRECEVCGITVRERCYNGSLQQAYNELRSSNPNAYIIIASDQFSIKDKSTRTLQIQHGIAFDIPAEFIKGFWGRNRFLIHVNKLLRCISNMRRLYQVPNTVCVDYNYYNWFRTIGVIPSKGLVRVIPNYASRMISSEQLEAKLRSESPMRRIIFARRFYDYRGTVLFANVAQRLLQEFDDVEIVFAGDGPMREFIEDKFAGNNRVSLMSFTADRSVEVHREFHISVVPTIYSEGTSLSLCEAMAAGCFVVATHVGGMTNMILDHHNGLLAYPDEENVHMAMVEALNMPQERFLNIVRNGYTSVADTFSLEHWRACWTTVLQHFIA